LEFLGKHFLVHRWTGQFVRIVKHLLGGGRDHAG